VTHFGAERSRKILDSFRDSVDPLALEVTAIEDRIGIELNVATTGRPHFKDAAIFPVVRSAPRSCLSFLQEEITADYRSAGGQPRQSFYF